MLVLQLDITSARAIAVAAGIMLMAAALSQLVDVLAARSRRWLHLALAAAFFVGNIVVMVWHDPTFAVLARIIAWPLLFKGIANVLSALFTMRGDGARWRRSRRDRGPGTGLRSLERTPPERPTM